MDAKLYYRKLRNSEFLIPDTRLQERTEMAILNHHLLMKRNHLIPALVLAMLMLSAHHTAAQPTKPDTVYTGIYVTSIHDIDFKQKEYRINLWLWMRYRNLDFDFVNKLEIPQAKTFDKSFSTLDSADGWYTLNVKLQCVMKDSWRIANFPFDQQKLRLSFENSQFDSRYLIFVPDTVGQHFDPRFTLSGWRIDSFVVNVTNRAYETSFGDRTLPKPHVEYSAYRVRMSITRDAMGLFWKMFLGMYVAFLIAFVCFFIHTDSFDSRFGLSVGALFAVVGNKYIIDSSLPDSTTFTLVDTLHGITLLFILLVVSATAYSLKLFKAKGVERADRFDKRAAWALLIIYVALNTWFIYSASR
jgi:hypothetical protein